MSFNEHFMLRIPYYRSHSGISETTSSYRTGLEVLLSCIVVHGAVRKCIGVSDVNLISLFLTV